MGRDRCSSLVDRESPLDLAAVEWCAADRSTYFFVNRPTHQNKQLYEGRVAW